MVFFILFNFVCKLQAKLQCFCCNVLFLSYQGSQVSSAQTLVKGNLITSSSYSNAFCPNHSPRSSLLQILTAFAAIALLVALCSTLPSNGRRHALAIS